MKKPWQNYTNMEGIRKCIMQCADFGEKVLIYGDYRPCFGMVKDIISKNL